MLEEKINSFIERLNTMKDSISTEEATKTSLIMPFFSMIGYDVFNPTEFVPEFTADVGIKRGEKVDYAIVLNEQPVILIEAKSITEKLEKHDSQLFRYFGTTNAKFAILTNGRIYKFYSDLDEPNKMDTSPFLEIDLLDLSDNEITELKKFEKENFDVESILSAASDLKYYGMIKKLLKDEFLNPTDDFIKFVLSNGIYEGRLMQNVIERFRPIVKKSISQYLNELVNDKIKNALNIDNADLKSEVVHEEIPDEEEESGIVTTEEELQAFYIVKSIICNHIPLERVTYKDTISYFSIIVDGKVTRWICRFFFKDTVKYVIIPAGNENRKYILESIDDIYKLSDVLVQRTKAIM
ncbi:MAG: endonuclease [Clostridiales bacterium]|nr:endonuclease [Clostridiales bacterium]